MSSISVTLLFFDGTKVPLTLDTELLSQVLYTESVDKCTVNELVDYIYTCWTKIMPEKEESNQPVYMSQIQLLHLGSRLDPETKISSLNLLVSPILHIVIKPVNMVRGHSDSVSSSRKFPKWMGSGNIVKPKGTNNEPVYRRRSHDSTLGGSLNVQVSNTVLPVQGKESVTEEEHEEQLAQTSQAELDTLSTAEVAVCLESTDNIPLSNVTQPTVDQALSRRISLPETTPVLPQPALNSSSGGCCIIA